MHRYHIIGSSHIEEIKEISVFSQFCDRQMTEESLSRISWNKNSTVPIWNTCVLELIIPTFMKRITRSVISARIIMTSSIVWIICLEYTENWEVVLTDSMACFVSSDPTLDLINFVFRCFQPKESSVACGSPSDDLFGYIHSMVSTVSGGQKFLPLVVPRF